jgi:hypothetical protein
MWIASDEVAGSGGIIEHHESTVKLLSIGDIRACPHFSSPPVHTAVHGTAVE